MEGRDDIDESRGEVAVEEAREEEAREEEAREEEARDVVERGLALLAALVVAVALLPLVDVALLVVLGLLFPTFLLLLLLLTPFIPFVLLLFALLPFVLLLPVCLPLDVLLVALAFVRPALSERPRLLLRLLLLLVLRLFDSRLLLRPADLPFGRLLDRDFDRSFLPARSLLRSLRCCSSFRCSSCARAYLIARCRAKTSRCHRYRLRRSTHDRPHAIDLAASAVRRASLSML